MQLQIEVGKPRHWGCPQVYPRINGLFKFLNIYFGKKFRHAHCKLWLATELTQERCHKVRVRSVHSEDQFSEFSSWPYQQWNHFGDFSDFSTGNSIYQEYPQLHENQDIWLP